MSDKTNKNNIKIEQRAINAFNCYLQNSTIISTIINSFDKVPSWDGYLYIYSDSKMDKGHFKGRISVQIKGRTVADFDKHVAQYKIDISDLKAYMYDPTLFILCEERTNPNEDKLFYCKILPEFIKGLMSGKENQKTITIPLIEIPESVTDFEEQMDVFIIDRRKQISFADKKSISLDELSKMEKFGLYVPTPSINVRSTSDLFRYFSSNASFLYVNPDITHDYDVPVEGGQYKLYVKEKIRKNISINGNQYYNEYTREYLPDNIKIYLSKDLSLLLPYKSTAPKDININFNIHFRYLSQSIHDLSFIIDMIEAGYISIGDKTPYIKKDDPQGFKHAQYALKKMKKIKSTLDKLHVTKDLCLSDITMEQRKDLDNIVKAIEDKVLLKSEDNEHSIYNIKIGNIRLLLIGIPQKNNRILLTDFFNAGIKISYPQKNSTAIETSCFTYLQQNDYWETIDNIPYDDQIPSYEIYVQKDIRVFDVANHDLFSMLLAYDVVKDSDKERGNTLLNAAIKLNDWLISSDKRQDNKILYIVNKYQIIKRQRNFNDEELKTLKSYLNDDNVEAFLKAEISLLLNDEENFNKHYSNSPKEIQQLFPTWPIWKFKNELK